MSKKQNLVFLSIAEVEYIAASSCCSQLLWMKKLLQNYGISQETMCIFCDNTSVINLSKNHVQHLKSKHIEIWNHFIHDLVEEKVVWLEFINTENQKADIFTKPLDGPWFWVSLYDHRCRYHSLTPLFGVALALLSLVHSCRRVHSFHHVMFLLLPFFA